MIKHEYDSLTKLDHPLISELLEVYHDDNIVYFVSPFYTGGELKDLLYKNLGESDDESLDSDECNPIPENQFKPMAYQILRAMNYLKNKNIFHRDLKPENMMLECPASE